MDTELRPMSTDNLRDFLMLPDSELEELNLRAKHILTAVNSGSEDEAALDVLNRRSEEYSDFLGARNRLAVRKGEKREPMEWVDAESTHQLPDELAKEAVRREQLRRAKL